MSGQQMAISYNFQDIVALFPIVDEYLTPNEYMSYTNYKDLLPTYFKHV